MKRRPLTRAQMLDRMPRAFRPKLSADQKLRLGLLHIQQLDAIATGAATEELMWEWVGSVLTWLKTAELLGVGTDEMHLQLELATRMTERYRATGCIVFSGPDYQLAKVGVAVMDDLAAEVDLPTAEQAAEWGEATLNKMSAACEAFRESQALGGIAA